MFYGGSALCLGQKHWATAAFQAYECGGPNGNANDSAVGSAARPIATQLPEFCAYAESPGFDRVGPVV